MLATQTTAAPAAPSPHLADTQQSDFHAVLASYASAAQPAQQSVARDVHANKPIKAIDRARSSTNDAKVSRKDARAEEKGAKKSEAKAGKDSENSQPVVAVEPVRAPAPVRTTAAPQPAANDDNEREASDTHVVEHAGSPKMATAPTAGTAPAFKNIPGAGTKASSDPHTKAALAQMGDEHAASTEQNVPEPATDRAPTNSLNMRVPSSAQINMPAAQKSAVAQTSEQSAPAISQNRDAQQRALVGMRAQAEPVSTQPVPTKEVSKQAIDDIIAAVKSDTKQPADNAVRQTAPSAAPGVVRMLAANVTAMLNAMRGTITVSSPKQTVPAAADVRPDATAVAKAAPADIAPRQSGAADKSSQNSPNAPIARSVQTAQVVQDTARDASETPKTPDHPAFDNDVKADVAKVDIAASGIVRTTTVPTQSAPNATRDVSRDQNLPAPDSGAKADVAKVDIVTSDIMRATAAPAQSAPSAPRDVSRDQNRPAPDSGVKADVATTVITPSDAVRANASAQTPAIQTNTDTAPIASKRQSRSASEDVQTGDAKADAAFSGAVRADAAPVAATPANPASQATASTQPVTPAMQIAAGAMPNAVNTTAAPQTSAAPHQLPAGLQSETPPNIPALAAAIAAKSSAGTKTFDIRMDPPELGRVDVHLSVDRDGKVQATLSAEQPQTLALLKQDSHNLERSLKDAGLDLSNNSLNFSLKGEGRQGDGGGAFTARARSLPDTVVARAEAANASTSNYNYASGDGRLDIRV